MHHTEVNIVTPEGGPIYPESQHDTKGGRGVSAIATSTQAKRI